MYIIFPYFATNHRLWVFVRTPQSVLNTYIKYIRFFFLSESFLVLVVKFSMYLNRRVFVMGVRFIEV